ncbi:MAG: DUF4301 family protein [Calditrichia bacterium]
MKPGKASRKDAAARNNASNHKLSSLQNFTKSTDSERTLHAACIGDGIVEITKSEEPRLITAYNSAASVGRSSQLVLIEEYPEFMRPLLQLYERGIPFDLEILEHSAITDDDFAVVRFFKRLSGFPFYGDLQTAFLQNGECLEELLQQKQHDRVLKMLLSAEGLNYLSKPIALMKCHQYMFDSRTMLEEHLVSSTAYVQDRDMKSRIRFSAPQKQAEALRVGLSRSVEYYEGYGVNFIASVSEYGIDETDTFSSSFVFLKELEKTEGDIVFVRCLNNTLHDRLKADSLYQRKLMGGMLVELQELIYYYCDRLKHQVVDADFLDHVVNFIQEDLNIDIREEFFAENLEELSHQLYVLLNRPIRICSVVPSSKQGENSPIWVQEGDQRKLRLLHVSEIRNDVASERQEWDNALFLNPVDMVCGILNETGEPFDLGKFSSANSLKATDLRAQLCGPAMSGWITILVSAGDGVYSPVDNILDLLQKEHQPAADSDVIRSALN